MPRKAGEEGKTLMQCECGRVMWLDAPGEVRRFHRGHRMKVAQNASLWVWLKLRLGLLNRLTWTERRMRRAGL